MTNAEYEAYAKAAAAKGEPVYPRDRGTEPKYFGYQYIGSSLKRKNDIRPKAYDSRIGTMKQEFSEKTLESKVRDILAETLMTGKRNIRREKTLVDELGADSLDFVEVVMELEKTFGITIKDDEAVQLYELTVGDLYKYVEGKL